MFIAQLKKFLFLLGLEGRDITILIPNLPISIYQKSLDFS